ncbi:MAG TPA: hypothetical protein PKD55_05855 [Bellilinea sp.]|nr:hypothetical protein [Bellilinea sp.]
MKSAAFARMASVTASTKRNPAAVAGKVGAPVSHLASLSILPVMPVTSQIVEMYRLQSPRESYVTYAEEADVLEGDTLTAAGIEYRVRAVSPWPGAAGYLEIVIERVKGT